MKRIILIALALVALAITATGCGSAADTVSKNLSKDAEQFRVQRRIVVINGITDKPELEVEGRCSVERGASMVGTLDVICKMGPNDYRKNMVGLSDNVFFTVTQLHGMAESEYHTKFIFRPESIVPGIDLVTGQQP